MSITTIVLASIANVTVAEGTNLSDAIAKYKNGEYDINVSEDGSTIDFVATDKANRRAKRADKAVRLAGYRAIILEALEQQRPLKINPILAAVKASTGADAKADVLVRLEVSAVLRELRDEGILTSSNATKSNFHMKWTLTAKPEAFPVPVVAEPAPEVTAEPVAEGDAPAADAVPTTDETPKATKKAPKAKKAKKVEEAAASEVTEAPAAEPAAEAIAA